MRNIDTANLILFEDLERTVDGFCKVRIPPLFRCQIHVYGQMVGKAAKVARTKVGAAGFVAEITGIAF